MHSLQFQRKFHVPQPRDSNAVVSITGCGGLYLHRGTNWLCNKHGSQGVTILSIPKMNLILANGTIKNLDLQLEDKNDKKLSFSAQDDWDLLVSLFAHILWKW
jgi:hypothetical protein